jgi:hypothetical protein
MEGAVERVRPKMMTVVAIMAGLLPIMWGTGTGSEVMSRIAAPMVGGMISSTVLTLAVIPAIYALTKQWLDAEQAIAATRNPRAGITRQLVARSTENCANSLARQALVAALHRTRRTPRQIDSLALDQQGQLGFAILFSKTYRFVSDQALFDDRLDFLKRAKRRRLEFTHPRRHQCALANIDRSGIALVLYGVIRKQPQTSFSLSKGAGALPLRPIQSVVCHRQLVLLSSRLEAVRLLIDHVLVKPSTSSANFRAASLRLSSAAISLRTSSNGRSLLGLHTSQLDDVKTEVRLHHAGNSPLPWRDRKPRLQRA